MTPGDTPPRNIGAHGTASSWTWQERSWVFAGFWLVFLIFPLLDILRTPDTAVALRILGVVGLISFAALYISYFRTERQIRARWGVPGLRWAALGVFAPALLTLPSTGYTALTFLPFACALTFSVLPYSHGFAMLAASVAIICGTAWAMQSWTILTFIMWTLFAAVPAGLGRFMGQGEVARAQIAQRISLAEDRDRVARDMHDVLGHTLTALTVKTELAERLIDTDPDAARAELQAVRSLTRQALAEVRSTVAGLRVARIDEELAAATATLAAAGITVDAPADPHVIDPQYRITLAWVLRETTTNVLRHAKASQVQIMWGPDWLTVTDNGRGIHGKTDGHGLTGLRERVSTMGGTLTLAAADPTAASNPGTVVTVNLNPNHTSPEVTNFGDADSSSRGPVHRAGPHQSRPGGQPL